MENYLVELAKTRHMLLEHMMSLNWGFSGRASKVQEINNQIKEIDRLIQQVVETDEPSKAEE